MFECILIAGAIFYVTTDDIGFGTQRETLLPFATTRILSDAHGLALHNGGTIIPLAEAVDDTSPIDIARTCVRQAARGVE